MKSLARYWKWNSRVNLQPTNVVRQVVTGLAVSAIVVVLFIPIDLKPRLQVLALALAGLAYAFVAWTPFLAGKRNLVDAHPFWIAICDSLLVSLVVAIMYENIPLIPIVYVIAIIGMAVRHGMRMALWSAIASTLGCLFTLHQLGALTTRTNDVGVLIVTFLIVALFTGSLAQAEKRRAEEFENVLTRSRDAIAIFDVHGTLEYLNPAMLELSGYTAADTIGHSFFDFIAHPIDAEINQILWRWLEEHPEPSRCFVVHVRAKDASLRTLSVTLTRLNPNPVRYMAIARDITQQEIERVAHERRDRELEAERQVALAVSEGQDLKQVLQLALDQASACTSADAGAIYLADDAQTELTLAVSRNLPDDYIRRIQQFRFGEGITGRSANERKILIVPNMEEEPAARPVVNQLNLLSKISVPLIAQDRVVGVLNVNGRKIQQFGESEAEILRAIASNVAMAIDHARLFESMEQRIQARTTELAALNRIAQAGTQSLELDAVLNATLCEVTDTLQVQGGWISLLDHATSLLNVRAHVGIPNDAHIAHLSQQIGTGLSGQTVLDGTAHAISLGESNLPWREQMMECGIQSLCGVPLIATGHTVGVLGLASDRKDRFGEAELRWLAAVGNTIGFALRNAQLYASVERQVIQLATLREIDRTLNSTLELAPMMEIILSSIAQVVPFDYAAVYLLEGTKMRAVAGRGIEFGDLSEIIFETNSDLAFAEMAREHKPIILNDLTPAVHHWSKIPKLRTVRAWMGTPLIARQAIIGQISLYSAMPDLYTDDDADWMRAFSNLAAVAIANARLRAELNEQARHDSLTQVLNHGAFIDELRTVCHQSLNLAEPLALIMFDLDNFKQYNDTYGHVIGDTVLALTAQTIRQHIKQRDFVGRWGGEEFGIAMPRTDQAHAVGVAQRIRKTLAEIHIDNGHGLVIPSPTASQGIASLGETIRDVDDLIDQADRALYRAKNHGRDQIAEASDLRR